MTPEQAKEAATVMLAFASGHKIECRSKSSHPTDWVEKYHMTWAFDEFDYRVAPEKWEGKLWVNFQFGHARDELYFSGHSPVDAGWKLITAKEV